MGTYICSVCLKVRFFIYYRSSRRRTKQELLCNVIGLFLLERINQLITHPIIEIFTSYKYKCFYSHVENETFFVYFIYLFHIFFSDKELARSEMFSGGSGWIHDVE